MLPIKNFFVICVSEIHTRFSHFFLSKYCVWSYALTAGFSFFRRINVDVHRPALVWIAVFLNEDLL